MEGTPGLPPPPPDPLSNTTDGSSLPIGQCELYSYAIIQNLAVCGYNETELEKYGVNTSFAATLNFTSCSTYWRNVVDKFNCSGDTTSSTQAPVVPAGFDNSPMIAYFAIVMVLGLVMNVCVIGTITQVRRLRTVTNMFLISLAIADLMMAAVVIPLQIHEFVKPQVVSDYLDAFFPVLGVASLLNLCAVTLDRYFTITNPLTYEAKISTRRVSIIIATIWIISIVQELLHLTINRKTTDNKASQEEIIFQTVRFAVAFSAPFICVLFVNAKIYLIARRHSKQIEAGIPNSEGRSTRSFSKKLKTARVIGLLVGTFMFTWLPYFLMTIYEFYHPGDGTSTSISAQEIGNTVCTALASSTALFNPLLYGLTRKEVRTAMWRCLKCQNANQMDVEASASAVTSNRDNDKSTRT